MQRKGVSQEQLRARATAVAHVMLARLLEHTRRGSLSDLWTVLLAECNKRSAAYEAATAVVTRLSNSPAAVAVVAASGVVAGRKTRGGARVAEAAVVAREGAEVGSEIQAAVAAAAAARASLARSVALCSQAVRYFRWVD